MTLYLTIHKSRGEDRVRVPGKGLVATQHEQFFAALRFGAPTATAHFFSRRKGSASLVRKDADQAFGPLQWRGTPDTDGMYGMAEITMQEPRRSSVDVS